MEKLLSADEIAELLGVKKSTIYQWTHQKYIPHIKLGNKVRFKPSQIDKWLEQRTYKGYSKRAIII
jgi:excisionase family DNA binding protein